MTSSGSWLSKDLRSRNRIHSAWLHVRSRGLRSRSRETADEVRAFEVHSDRHIKRISSQLRKYSYHFSPAHGILAKKKSGAVRPIVRAPIPDRIVQRAILDVLQDQPSVQDLFLTPTSFGGVRDRGVAGAIELAHGAILGGNHFYVRSDIKSFFTKIPRAKTVSLITSHLADLKFVQLVRDATEVELDNMDYLGEHAELFPLHDEGVAQGSALSSLLGNALLREFDETLNEGPTTCLRYVDDFVILGPTIGAVHAAFSEAQSMLQKFNMQAYSPSSDPEKADQGDARKGMNFLGCTIDRDNIRPATASQRKPIREVRSAINESINAINSGSRERIKRHSYASTLKHIDHILKGWGNQYSFCNAMDSMGNLDHEIDKLLEPYDAFVRKELGAQSGSKASLNRRRIRGVHTLRDSKHDPIVTTS